MVNRGLKPPAELWKDDRSFAQWARQAYGPAVALPEYTVLTLPDAAQNRGGMVAVTNEAGGYVSALSDGTNWRRQTDRAIVS